MDIKKKRLSRAIKSSFILIFWVSILFLGNLFINNMAEEHAKAAQVKENLIPYVIGCVIIFGAFGIWKIVLTVLQSFQ